MFRTEVAITTEKLMIPRGTADGSPAEMPVFVARPQGAAGIRRPALVLIQEIFGVNPHIQDVAQRFAAAGYVVVAPDFFYRTGHWQAFGYDHPIEEIRKSMAGLNEDVLIGDLTAAMDYLATLPDVDTDRIGTVGYCFGGRMSLIAAIRLPDRVKAAAVYYGGGIVADAPSAPVHRVSAVRCPVIGFFGALDKHIPQEVVERLERALTEAGVRNEIYCYPYADHGFFCDARATFHPRAAEDAWYRTLRFFEANLGPVPEVAWR